MIDQRITILKADITTLSVDAIVNAANPSLMGGGVDGAIHRSAGPKLKEACRPLRGCHTGDAKITPGFNLPSRFVIHAVGPVWNNGTNSEERMLASAYRRCLDVAIENDLRSIAFPSISTGAYRFPFERATRIAISEISKFLAGEPSLDQIFLVAFGERDFQHMKRIYKDIEDETSFRKI